MAKLAIIELAEESVKSGLVCHVKIKVLRKQGSGDLEIRGRIAAKASVHSGYTVLLPVC